MHVADGLMEMRDLHNVQKWIRGPRGEGRAGKREAQNRAQGSWNTEKWCLMRSILVDLGKKQQKFKPAMKVLNARINVYKECTANRLKEMDVACYTCRSKSCSSQVKSSADFLLEVSH